MKEDILLAENKNRHESAYAHKFVNSYLTEFLIHYVTINTSENDVKVE
jgi:hypothetical protein